MDPEEIRRRREHQPEREHCMMYEGIQSLWDQPFISDEWANEWQISATPATPAGEGVDADGNGGIQVENGNGGVQVEDGNGGVQVEDGNGGVQVEDGNGGVQVEDGNGGVQVEDGNGEVQVLESEDEEEEEEEEAS